MNLLLILLLLNAAHLILTVNEPKVGKFRPNFDEIYGKEWDEGDHQQIKVETSPLNSGEDALNEQADHDDNIDQDIEAYNSDSTHQNLTQEDPESIDQNLTQEDPESIDQSDDETIEGIIDENEFSEQEKREIISKFHSLKEEFKKKGKLAKIERVKIECKIGNKLGANRNKIYKWKKEFGLSRKTKTNNKSFYEKKKREFIARIEDIKICQNGEQNKLAEDLGISEKTFIIWKKEFGLPVNSKFIYSDNEKLELIRKYYKTKQRNPQIRDIDIANILNIGYSTLRRWKKELKNSVDEHSLPENRSTFADNDTSEHPMPSSDDNLWAWNLAKKKRTERTEVEHCVKK